MAIAVVKSAIGLAALAPEHAAIVVGKRVLRVDADGVVVIGERAIAIAFFLPGETARHVGGAPHGVSFVSVLDDARATGDVAIRIVGVAILMRVPTGAPGWAGNRRQHAN